MRSHHPCLCCPSIHSVVSNESVNRICPKTRFCMALPMLCGIYFADREEYELITPGKNEKQKQIFILQNIITKTRLFKYTEKFTSKT